MPHGPVVRRRRLGEELRSLRHASGLTSRDAARLLGWHQSKVSRIETGASGVSSGDVARLLDVYGVRDAPSRALLEVLAGSAGRGGPGWWHAYRGLIPPHLGDFISLESQADAVRTLETSVVPGLLQTAGYARAVIRASLDGAPPDGTEPDGTSPDRTADHRAAALDSLDSLVEVRLTRQRVLRATRPPRFTAVLDEAVLRREVGGPAVMRDQVGHLQEMSRLPHVTVRLLPFSSGGYPGLTTSFAIFSFPATADLDVIVLDHLTSGLYLERREDLRTYGAAFRALQERALSPERSRDLMAGIRRDHARSSP
ncbi:helix-turn-helix domain-containing protein [Streptomyces sp. NPDC101181]|uniref:helix-turn-helix domain-containing protein n=1 Tax=Streptomyces sp. NPDC101181 TaxID=3366125 RepID=UPI00382564C3